MIKLGDYNTLKIVRATSVGLFLEDEEGTEILLPNKYVPEDFKIDTEMEVFCYLDNSERPVATTLKPYIFRNGFAYLKVAEVSAYGAFLEWGLEKHLLVPFREQAQRMEEGKKYMVYCYMDEESMRLTGSSKLDKFLVNEGADYKPNTEVDLLVYRKTPLGWEVIVDNKYKGLIFDSDIFKPVSVGSQIKGYVKKVRDDHKIDISLQPIGAKMLEPTAKIIFDKLQQNNGFLPLHDKSSPEEIQSQLHLSKKAFKKGVGILYRQRKITIQEDGIRLL
ncbi:S1 RNA-binding domain-containing protein [Flagellimonas aequoris]|uniref:GntR family transcriptional regulator n=1 Tax=Flagellimonas aequoris TaxID=2306997 RepID=A0A418N575_9FLAO|nr:S1-like domain-containing RNA-binding protein [Allomuricauda aequoris]RIV68899.1 GntR family transcriptional regulator [Allomuricauda aequoris]TXK00603.1 GntR family transcriptional regulator [Allomuricauda aequoris]